MEKTYTVREATEITGVKSHVLRYWEEELSLRIGRNDQGHRCYTGYDIQLFMNIKELKKRGLALHAIKELIPRIAQTVPGESGSKIRLLEGEVSGTEVQTGVEAFDVEKTPAEEVFSPSGNMPEDKNPEDKIPEDIPGVEKLRAAVNGAETEKREFQNDKILKFEEILERLIHREVQIRNAEEARCRSLDLAIRKQQQARRETAAANEKKTVRRVRTM